MNYPLITGTTKLYGLLGSPVKHSVSPLMHNEGFRQLGIDAVYLCFDVNEANLKQTVSGLRTLNIQGFNCTMPTKTAICQLVDELSPAAKMIGAVNTVVNQNGTLIGHNTDGVGYMMAVKEAGYQIIGKKMTMLGAGGAATAICAQAALDGVAEISIFSRRSRFFPRAEKLVHEINTTTSCKAVLHDYDDPQIMKNSIHSSDILINGTSVGMSPETDRSLIPDHSYFHPDLIVSDIIYNPTETKLLNDAREYGCATFNGMYMLLFQGAEAFRLWTGQNMPITIIKDKYFS